MLKQLNWCLNPQDFGNDVAANTSMAIKGFMDLLKALKYVVGGSSPATTDVNTFPITPEDQAKTILHYLREIKRILNVTNIFTLTDFL